MVVTETPRCGVGVLRREPAPSGGWEGRRKPTAVVPGLPKGCSGCREPSPRSLWLTCHSSGLSAEQRQRQLAVEASRRSSQGEPGRMALYHPGSPCPPSLWPGGGPPALCSRKEAEGKRKHSVGFSRGVCPPGGHSLPHCPRVLPTIVSRRSSSTWQSVLHFVQLIIKPLLCAYMCAQSMQGGLCHATYSRS